MGLPHWISSLVEETSNEPKNDVFYDDIGRVFSSQESRMDNGSFFKGSKSSIAIHYLISMHSSRRISSRRVEWAATRSQSDWVNFLRSISVAFGIDPDKFSDFKHMLDEDSDTYTQEGWLGEKEGVDVIIDIHIPFYIWKMYTLTENGWNPPPTQWVPLSSYNTNQTKDHEVNSDSSKTELESVYNYSVINDTSSRPSEADDTSNNQESPKSPIHVDAVADTQGETMGPINDNTSGRDSTSQRRSPVEDNNLPLPQQNNGKRKNIPRRTSQYTQVPEVLQNALSEHIEKLRKGVTAPKIAKWQKEELDTPYKYVSKQGGNLKKGNKQRYNSQLTGKQPTNCAITDETKLAALISVARIVDPTIRDCHDVDTWLNKVLEDPQAAQSWIDNNKQKLDEFLHVDVDNSDTEPETNGGQGGRGHRGRRGGGNVYNQMDTEGVFDEFFHSDDDGGGPVIDNQGWGVGGGTIYNQSNHENSVDEFVRDNAGGGGPSRYNDDLMFDDDEFLESLNHF